MLLMAAAVMVAVCGCKASRINVPANTVRFKSANGSLDITHPQDAAMTNVVVSIATNGTVKATIGGMITKNSPQVISATAAGEVAKINALGTQIREGFKAGMEAVGGAVGGAVK